MHHILRICELCIQCSHLQLCFLFGDHHLTYLDPKFFLNLMVKVSWDTQTAPLEQHSHVMDLQSQRLDVSLHLIHGDGDFILNVVHHLTALENPLLLLHLPFEHLTFLTLAGFHKSIDEYLRLLQCGQPSLELSPQNRHFTAFLNGIQPCGLPLCLQLLPLPAPLVHELLQLDL